MMLSDTSKGFPQENKKARTSGLLFYCLFPKAMLSYIPHPSYHGKAQEGHRKFQHRLWCSTKLGMTKS